MSFFQNVPEDKILTIFDYSYLDGRQLIEHTLFFVPKTVMTQEIYDDLELMELARFRAQKEYIKRPSMITDQDKAAFDRIIELLEGRWKNYTLKNRGGYNFDMQFAGYFEIRNNVLDH